MTGKELVDQIKDENIPCLNIGTGDTVFRGGKHDGVYVLQFNLLSNPVAPGTDAGEEATMAAKPYFMMEFGNIESLGVFSGFAETLYQHVLEQEGKGAEVKA